MSTFLTSDDGSISKKLMHHWQIVDMFFSWLDPNNSCSRIFWTTQSTHLTATATQLHVWDTIFFAVLANLPWSAPFVATATVRWTFIILISETSNSISAIPPVIVQATFGFSFRHSVKRGLVTNPLLHNQAHLIVKLWQKIRYNGFQYASGTTIDQLEEFQVTDEEEVFQIQVVLVAVEKGVERSPTMFAWETHDLI